MAYTDIDKPSDYFNTVLHSGDNSSPESISGFGFQPDWVWTKCRTAAYDHSISDSVRGANKTIRSNNTSAEVSNDVYGNLTAFNSDGFTATSGSSSINYYNQSGQTYVNWGWLASNTTASNTDGSITSTVSANTTSGFSIVSYTGNATANATVGHGLGVAPSMMIVKKRNGAFNWGIYHKTLTAHKLLAFTTGTPDDDASYWNDVEPTSSVFNLGSGALTNGSGSTMIAYCFAEKKGYSKFGSYIGGGSNFPFVYTGFKPIYLLAKRTDSADEWIVQDGVRAPFNEVDVRLFVNAAAAEQTNGYGDVDFLANGFKWRTNSATLNASGGSYIYMAFAENPFVTGSSAIPATAR